MRIFVLLLVAASVAVPALVGRLHEREQEDDRPRCGYELIPTTEYGEFYLVTNKGLVKRVRAARPSR